MATNEYAIELYSGDNVYLEVSLTDSDGNEYPEEDINSITLATYVLSENSFYPEIITTKTIGNGIWILNGKIYVRIDGSDTESTSGIYRHELQIIDSEGTKTTVFKDCNVSIIEDIITG